jgi:hypothetical protein
VHLSAAQRAAFLRISECMREHGVTGFPDPTTIMPTDPQDDSAVADLGGIVLAIPKSIDMSSPVAIAAVRACHFQGI